MKRRNTAGDYRIIAYLPKDGGDIIPEKLEKLFFNFPDYKSIQTREKNTTTFGSTKREISKSLQNADSSVSVVYKLLARAINNGIYDMPYFEECITFTLTTML